VGDSGVENERYRERNNVVFDFSLSRQITQISKDKKKGFCLTGQAASS
jgi:hypothetical protein